MEERTGPAPKRPGPPRPDESSPPWRGGQPWTRQARDGQHWDGQHWAGPGWRSSDWHEHGHGRLGRRIANRWGHGPLRRTRDGRMAGGIAAGLSARTGFDVTLIRIVFVIATLFTSGIVLAGYMLTWLLVARSDEDSNIATRALEDRRGMTLAVAFGALLAVVLLIVSELGAGWLNLPAWPLVISAAALVLIWRNAPVDEQELVQRALRPLVGQTSGRYRRWRTARLILGAALLVAGMVALLQGHPSRILLRQLGAVTLVIAAIVVLLGPWWLGIARDLMVERQARARAEERADIASQLHDSVLQTLALIQRRANDPQKVVQLARAQERELRGWLFDGRPPGSLGEEGLTLAAGVRLIQQEVEAQHGKAVEAVTVGDCELDDDLTALLAAAREATVNAVKWSGAPVVSMFAEVEPAAVSIFVRDRGVGFDPDSVPKDRRGLTESIHGRMARRGGTATVRSVRGEGTEVSLTMPRSAGQRQPSRT